MGSIYDIDRYLKLVEAYRSVRESVLESDKIQREIRNSHKEDERLELERKKKYINDIIDIGKFILKLCATGLLAALALSNVIAGKEILIWACTGGVLFGIVILIIGLEFRSNIEADYIEESKKLSSNYDENLKPLIEYAAAISNEVAILNEMVRLEQETIAEQYPATRDFIFKNDIP